MVFGDICQVLDLPDFQAVNLKGEGVRARQVVHQFVYVVEKQFCRCAHMEQLRVSLAVVPGLLVALYVPLVGIELCLVITDSEAVKVGFRRSIGLTEVNLYGIMADGVGIGKVAVQACAALPSDGRVRGILVNPDCLLDITLCRYIVVLRYIQRKDIAGAHPHAVFVPFLDCYISHLLNHVHSLNALAVVEEIILRQFVSVVVILEIAEFLCNFFEVVRLLKDILVRFGGGFQIPVPARCILEGHDVIERLGLGVAFFDGDLHELGIGGREFRGAGLKFCLAISFKTLVVQLIRIVLRQSSCSRREKSYDEQKKLFHILKYKKNFILFRALPQKSGYSHVKEVEIVSPEASVTVKR